MEALHITGVRTMKIKKLYTCDICRTDYSDKEKAVQCRKSQKQIIEIKDTRYSANGAYPHKILVKFKDGHEIWYRV